MDQDLLFNKYIDTQSFCTDAFDIVQEVCASSNNLPESGEEFDFYQSFSDVAEMLGQFRTRLLASVNKLLKNFTSSPPLASLEQNIDEHIERIVEANDELLERISNELDEVGGVKKTATTIIKTKSSWRSPAVRYSAGVGMTVETDASAVQKNEVLSQTILKPQLNFVDKVDNSNFPFVPKLTRKPHAIKPLPAKLCRANRQIDQNTLDRQPELLDHPYATELDQFLPSPEALELATPQPPVEWDKCPFTLVSEPSQLEAMLKDLKKAKEIAVDLEHHNLRSYMGFTCLMQISTRWADYVVDTFSLRQHLQILNEVFADPSILKVFHGAESDIVWLQKDFGVYVVNMFDSHQAARLLGFPYLSLSFLLKRYCDVDAAKRYQRADWRVRPLPNELVDYARTDTHYLLYIYDLMRNELVEKSVKDKSLLLTAYERSKMICLRKYEKPIFKETDHLRLIKDTSRYFNSRQLHALKLLYEWRDRVAREEDESVDFVLPNHMLMKIAEYLPKEKQGIFGCCNPIPVHVKQNLVEIHQYVIRAREVELVKEREDFPNEDEYFEPPPFDPDSALNCVHDHIHSSENVTKEFDDLDSLQSALAEMQINRNLVVNEQIEPCQLQIFQCRKKKQSDAFVELMMKSMINPILPYIPIEMMCELERKIVQSEERKKELTWYLLPNEKAAKLSDDDTGARKVEVIPTPAEINNADDLVPLKRRKTKETQQQPPSVPLLTSYLKRAAVDSRNKVATTIKQEAVSNVTPYDYEAIDFEAMKDEPHLRQSTHSLMGTKKFAKKV